jgi:peptidoglycan/LPS O-acetylase OafA/YrhL
MGYLRFILAITVTVAHLWATNMTGVSVAVFGFYCLSGFLMTKVIHETYGDSLKGKALFLLNRLIRIYPPYYLCLLIGLWCIAAIPDAHTLNPRLIMPNGWSQWLPQILIFGLNDINKNLNPVGMANLYPVRILPAAWSLNIELMYYLWMCLAIGISVRRTIAWVALSVCISAYLLWKQLPFDYHYYTIYNPSICFAAGASLYHFRPFMGHVYKLGVWAAIFVGGLLAYIPSVLGFSVYSHPWYLYVTIPIYMYVLFCLDDPWHASPREQMAADLSYPLFLLHVAGAALFLEVLKPHTFLFWAASTSLSLLFSFFIAKITNTVFLPIRKSIRQEAKLPES